LLPHQLFGGGTFVPAACNALFRFAAAANRFVAASILRRRDVRSGGVEGFVSFNGGESICCRINYCGGVTFVPTLCFIRRRRRTNLLLHQLLLRRRHVRSGGMHRFVSFGGGGKSICCCIIFCFVPAACNTSFHLAAAVNRFVAAPIVAAVARLFQRQTTLCFILRRRQIDLLLHQFLRRLHVCSSGMQRFVSFCGGGKSIFLLLLFLTRICFNRP
jgi:hypothetical protein